MSFVTFPFSFRHWQSAQPESTAQGLLRHVVDGHEIPCLFHSISHGEFFLYASLILRASGIARVAILARSANITLDTQRIQQYIYCIEFFACSFRPCRVQVFIAACRELFYIVSSTVYIDA